MHRAGSAERSSEPPAPADRNEVTLVGRLAAAAQERVLPSGDRLVTFRLVVGRPPRPRPDGRAGPTVDTLDCASYAARVQRSALACAPGDVVELHGALRRRFWRGPAGPASRYEVEVLGLRRRRAA